MKNRWDQRVYLDLYAGAGHSRVQGTNKFLKASPLIALTVPYPFDKYIFCEESPDLMRALRLRVKRVAPSEDVDYVEGNCDAKIADICDLIPKASVSRSR